MITSVNNQPVRVEDVVEGGRASPGELGRRGSRRQPSDAAGADRLLEGRPRTPARALRSASPRSATTSPDKVECIVLMRKNEETLPALKDVEAKVDGAQRSRNGPAAARRQDRAVLRSQRLLAITTETVRENLVARHGAGDRDPADVSEQRPQCADRGDQHSAGPVLRVRRAVSCGASRPICCRSARSISASSSIRR